MNIDETEAVNYWRIQARLLAYTSLFWLSVLLLSRHRYELVRLRRFFLALIEAVISKTGLVERIRGVKEQVRLAALNYDIFVNAQHVFRGINTTLYRVGEWVSLKNVPNASLGALILANVAQCVRLLTQVHRSLATIVATFSFNLKRALQWPVRVKQVLSACALEIRGFWRQIEQIIQIVKLPLEILALIFSFIKGITSFMRRIETPRIGRFR